MKHEQVAHTIKKASLERLASMIEIGNYIYDHPQPGFTEYETAAYTASIWEKAGFSPFVADDIPYASVMFDTSRPGPTVAVIGEMDCVFCSEHPDSKPDGSVHACGHHVGMANMIGASLLLAESDLLSQCSGKIKFMAVPAEEHIQQEFRLDLIKKGQNTFCGGKAELFARGYFDDVDMAYMLHMDTSDKKIRFGASTNGCLIKNVSYTGKAAHAGGAPHMGKNALYACHLGMHALNALRETFREEDFIRVHPIVTKGGDTVNVIPSTVDTSMYVRARSTEAMLRTSEQVDRAWIGGAVSMGCDVTIENIAGYFPMKPDRVMETVAKQAAGQLLGSDDIGGLDHIPISTDMGDLSMVMPVIHPFLGGAAGGLHSADFRIADEENAYGTGAAFLAFFTWSLLADQAKQANHVITEYQPQFSSRQEFCRFLRSINKKSVYQSDRLWQTLTES